MHKLTRPVVCNQTDNCLIKLLPLQLMRRLSLLSAVSSAPSLPAQGWRHKDKKKSPSKKKILVVTLVLLGIFFHRCVLALSCGIHLEGSLPAPTIPYLKSPLPKSYPSIFCFFKQMYYSLNCVKTILWADRGTTLGTWKKRQRVVCTCRWGWTDLFSVVYYWGFLFVL